MNKEIIEVKYSQKTIIEMRTVNGVFDKERKKLKKHKFNEPFRYRVFKPIIPEGFPNLLYWMMLTAFVWRG